MLSCRSPSPTLVVNLKSDQPEILAQIRRSVKPRDLDLVLRSPFADVSTYRTSEDIRLAALAH